MVFTVKVYCEKCLTRHTFKIDADILAEAKEIAAEQVKECPGPIEEETE